MPDDDAGWCAWFQQHLPALVLYARQWTNAHADAEDIVQEALLRFWRADRRRVADPVAYVYASVKHGALDQRRSAQARSRREKNVGRARGEAEAFLDAPLEQRERRDAIELALRRLPDEQREVLVMKVWGELTFAQIAAALEIPLNTAASRHRYALAALRAILSEEGEHK